MIFRVLVGEGGIERMCGLRLICVKDRKVLDVFV